MVIVLNHLNEIIIVLVRFENCFAVTLLEVYMIFLIEHLYIMNYPMNMNPFGLLLGVARQKLIFLLNNFI